MIFKISGGNSLVAHPLVAGLVITLLILMSLFIKMVVVIHLNCFSW